MQAIEQVLFLRFKEDRKARRYIIDAIVAVLLSLCVTIGIFYTNLYPRIPNISFLYLLVVLGLAIIYGSYAAIVASIISFFFFDFFLVPPLYTFSIHDDSEWLALFIFLITAIITGQLASALRQRAQQATLRERETRALYDTMNATINENDLGRQLDIVANAIVTHFASLGVVDCGILLPDTQKKPILWADARQDSAQMQLSNDEIRTAESVLRQGKIVDVYTDDMLASSESAALNRYRRVLQPRETRQQQFVRMIPLEQGTRVVGVARLQMADGYRRFPIERGMLNNETERWNHQATFFWTFCDQIIAMIERARLHQEAVQIELLQRTDALRSALLSSVSHDLRTPLSSIKAAASSLLQEDVEWDEETQKGFALAIERQADRLNRLVGNLLDMSRIEGGALKPEKEWYPLEELVHDVVGHMQNVLQGRDVQIQLPETLPPVEIDYLQMDQVLTNLIENAVRYTPVGSPLELEAHVVDTMVQLSLKDHGPGIPPYDLERIFDKFYRVSHVTRKATSIMGTGLGLAVCRGLVEAHGGRIWAENAPEGGAIFRFTLPVGETEEQIG